MGEGEEGGGSLLVPPLLRVLVLPLLPKLLLLLIDRASSPPDFTLPPLTIDFPGGGGECEGGLGVLLLLEVDCDQSSSPIKLFIDRRLPAVLRRRDLRLVLALLLPLDWSSPKFTLISSTGGGGGGGFGLLFGNFGPPKVFGGLVDCDGCAPTLSSGGGGGGFVFGRRLIFTAALGLVGGAWCGSWRFCRESEGDGGGFPSIVGTQNTNDLHCARVNLRYKITKVPNSRASLLRETSSTGCQRKGFQTLFAPEIAQIPSMRW